jgi:excisionase family DNA binding protein
MRYIIHVINQSRLLDSKYASVYLSIGRTLLYQLAIEEKIPSIKIKSRRLFYVNDLDDFVERIKHEQLKRSILYCYLDSWLSVNACQFNWIHIYLNFKNSNLRDPSYPQH